jgi:hypothetical protein
MQRYADLRPHLLKCPGFEKYEKGLQDVFERTRARLPDALKNAKRANADALKADTDNPMTEVVGLVEYLESLSAGRLVK